MRFDSVEEPVIHRERRSGNPDLLSYSNGDLNIRCVPDLGLGAFYHNAFAAAGEAEVTGLQAPAAVGPHESKVAGRHFRRTNLSLHIEPELKVYKNVFTE